MAELDATNVVVPFFKKKGRSRPATTRQRSPSYDVPVATNDASKSQVVLPTRKAAGNLLSAGTKRTSTQRDEYGDTENTAKEGPDVKWTASGSHTQAALDILAGDEVEEMLVKRHKKDEGVTEEETPDDGQYHGQRAYRKHIKMNTEVPKSMRIGPQRSTSTIRTVTIVDYQPDVCKDYKETGYCGFGDTCKFLHDRGTYLAGWQLDKLAENAKKQVDDAADSESDSDDDIPFACHICRNHYTDPVVTRCGHYFCSACAIKRFAKTPRCSACGAPTGGIFNRADKVIEKINKKRAAQDANDHTHDAEQDVEIEGLQDDEAPE